MVALLEVGGCVCVDGGACQGGWGLVRWWWWDFKASCLLRGTVISGERGEAWRTRPWILVTGCWWSPPTFPGTPRSGIYSRKCRSKSWAARRPSADTHRANENEGWAHIHSEIGPGGMRWWKLSSQQRQMKKKKEVWIIWEGDIMSYFTDMTTSTAFSLFCFF